MGICAAIFLSRVLDQGKEAFREIIPPWGINNLMDNAIVAILGIIFAVSAYALRSPESFRTIQAGNIHSNKAALLGASLLLAAALTHFISPTFFNWLTLEDYLVEWSSALTLLAASLVTFLCLLNIRKTNAAKWHQLILLGMVGAFFVMGMEEISWMQRVFGVETPELFADNNQKEMNLHNFASRYFNLMLYMGGFTAFVLLPFAYDMKLKTLGFIRYFDLYIPGRYVAYMAAPLVASNYIGWSLIPIQLHTYFTLAILGVYAYIARKESRKDEALIVWLIVLACILSQTIFLFNTDYIRAQAPMEFKEFLIGFSCLVYAYELKKKIKVYNG